MAKVLLAPVVSPQEEDDSGGMTGMWQSVVARNNKGWKAIQLTRKAGILNLLIGAVCQFVLACPAPTPHAPIAWSYHLGAWDGVGTARTTQSGRYGPEKLSRPAGSTERRWGGFLPVPSRGAR